MGSILIMEWAEHRFQWEFSEGIFTKVWVGIGQPQSSTSTLVNMPTSLPSLPPNSLPASISRTLQEAKGQGVLTSQVNLPAHRRGWEEWRADIQGQSKAMKLREEKDMTRCMTQAWYSLQTFTRSINKHLVKKRSVHFFLFNNKQKIIVLPALRDGNFSVGQTAKIETGEGTIRQFS